MANQVALSPIMESMTVTETPMDIQFTDLKSYLDHPFNPWGPITKFYVRFTVHPVRQLFFSVHGRSDSRSFNFDALTMGVVLAREYEGGTNLCIWTGQIVDGLVNKGGIDVEMAKGVAKNVHDWLTDAERGWRKLKIGVHVEIRVVTPVLIQDVCSSSSSSNNGIYGYP